MMKEEIRVAIIGEIDKLEKSLKKASSLLNQFKDQAIASFDVMRTQMGDFGGGVGQLGIFQMLKNILPDVRIVTMGVGKALQKLGMNLFKAARLSLRLHKYATLLKEGFNKFAPLLREVSKGISAVGKKISWFGFRLYYTGRILTRIFIKPLTQAVNLFKNWEKTIGDIGLAMGFLAASGDLSGEAQERMISAMQVLPGLGMMVQGMFGNIASLLAQIGTDIIPTVTSAINDLVDAFSVAWKESSPFIKELLKDFAENTLPKLVSLIKEVGPDLMKGLAQGFIWAGKAIKFILEKISYLNKEFPWLAKTIGKVSGAIIGLAPIMMPLGAIILAVGGAIGFLGAAFAVLSNPIGLVVAAIVAVHTVLSNLGHIGRWVQNIFIELARILPSIVKKLTDPLSYATDALKGLGKMLDNISDKFGVAKRANADFVSDLESDYGESIGDVMASQFKTAEMAMESLKESMGADRMTPGLPAQNITINMDFSGNMTSETDLDRVVDEVSRVLAKELEGVYTR